MPLYVRLCNSLRPAPLRPNCFELNRPCCITAADTFMNILLQNKKTLSYVTDLSKWTMQHEKAHSFGTGSDALFYCFNRQLKNMRHKRITPVPAEASGSRALDNYQAAAARPASFSPRFSNFGLRGSRARV